MSMRKCKKKFDKGVLKTYIHRREAERSKNASLQDAGCGIVMSHDEREVTPNRLATLTYFFLTPSLFADKKSSYPLRT